MAKLSENVICVTCPKGCTLIVTRDGETVIDVENGCKRGKDYAQQELIDPRRMVASSVRLKGGLHPLLPVYTSVPFPKPRIPELLALLRKIEISTPVTLDQIVLENVLDTGINIHASREMKVVTG
ncbi:MAG: molybdopterin oxidoreductase [Chloroflexi bacterium HGW-Chloroflexi-4]|jgi:CxxC motif-containing protein|nr:MAG: molybdopterin oxidoreductase [Chloroflexi bacterium HGW-Chloroflexi-4]